MLSLETGITGGPLPDIELTTNCPSCGVGLDPEELRQQAYVCECGHHFRLHADAWAALLSDEGTWLERWADIRPHDLLQWRLPRPYRETIDQASARELNEAVRTGTGTIGGQPIWLGIFDFRFVGGTLSIVAGERLARSFEQAANSRLPYVLVTATGGARMQEGILALMQMAKINAAAGRLHASRVPFFSVLTDPTYGGVSASLALIADVNLAEPGAAIGFTGPRVIRQSTYADLPPGFQSAEFQLEHGQVDMVVPRTELRSTLASLVRLHTQVPGSA
ncbi:MAG TPA: acetyl-CoA carboxylase carboxyltransferase subunit beta [Candidatus Dormibacteraeota bacterium]|jgi:acetyl-CoA carboxylase carboxyl transferase subunit beta|nr:acetyl-CoA carboxylase carboxyltransferase subunit beta [Candidatus Dormibacteraeota bacterium]